ncbi:MAG: serine hydrolase [Chloroflexota bacterium]
MAHPVFSQDEERAAGVLEYIAEAGEDVGIACYRVDQPFNGVFTNGDERYPLASTIKVMILGVYAQGAASGRFDPTERVPLADLDLYYLPRTDGGAHPAFLADVEADEDETLSLLEVVYGMIRFSSNAAADYLHARMTDTDFEDFYALTGVINTEIPVSLLGLFLAQDNHETGISDMTMPREELRASAADWQDKYVNDAAWRAAERAYRPNASRRYLTQGIQLIPTQSAFFAKYDNRGTPEDFARVMAVVQSGEILSATAGAVMRATLSWPMQFEANRERFYTIGTKGGSLPGILTGVYFAQPKNREPLVLAVFYRNLPPDIYVTWLRSFEQQELEFYVLVNGCDALTSAELIGQGTGN